MTATVCFTTVIGTEIDFTLRQRLFFHNCNCYRNLLYFKTATVCFTTAIGTEIDFTLRRRLFVSQL